MHARIEMPGNQTGKLEFPAAVESPYEFSGFTRGHMRHVGFIMLHLWKALHHLGVFKIVRLGTQDELVHDLPIVFHNEFNGFTLLEFERRRVKPH